MAKSKPSKKNSVRTSTKVATLASKTLADNRATPKAKTLSGSALVNRKK